MTAGPEDNVIDLPVITRLDLDPDRLLQKAIGQMESVVILGHTKDGEEYFAASQADAAEVIYHLERAKYALMQTIDRMEKGGAK